ncbi:D-tyrosyl-tRNA(Tyr) deacylase [Acholeplasma morum]|uniref:D-aminoacyl-tRNA deacylase n=1 Tax=Paracholeplasma morum TaxID=264637 RepID=UPI00195675E0|nr:D-aminoacyl-tRNA deacylase [Paracholeplasma morum]MBM7453610.1 D-tyrosyl-tRNA(Tyr) deacylase [Paracholeplasma morum]
MRAVIQRVSEASVSTSDYHQSIEKGYLVLLGVHVDDTDDDYQYTLKKIINLRVFEDDNQKMNLSIKQVNGEILLISQFTLLGNVKGNNRPSFTTSAKSEFANQYYERLYHDLNLEVPTKKGVFGADMQVKLVNSGPVTIIIDTKE